MKLILADGRYELVLKARPVPGRCLTLKCTNDVKGGRTGFICSKCLSFRWRANNPQAASWVVLNRHAKRRKIPVLLTFEEFKQWGTYNGYFDTKGRGAWDMTIERKDSRLGYELSNMTLLTNTENGRKGNAERANAHVRRALQQKGVPYEYWPEHLKAIDEPPDMELPDRDDPF